MARFRTVLLVSMFWQLLVFGAIPEFHLVAVRIEGTQADVEGIVISELRLPLEKSYSETELFRAMVRLRRLPFVLDAEFRLEKGTEFQTYILVIDIKETKRFFIDSEASVFRISRYSSPDQTEEEVLGRNRLTLGYRTFPSSQSQLYGALSPGITLSERDQEIPIRATGGFAHHNLGGGGRFFNLEAFYSEGETSFGSGEEDEVDGTYLGVDVLYALPLRKSQWLRFGSGARWDETSFQTRYIDFFQNQTTIQRRNNDRDLLYFWADWDWNTLNDHALPTSGMRFKPGLALVRQRTNFSLSQIQKVDEESFIDNRDAIAGFLTYEQYWQFLPRSTIFLRTGIRVARESVETQETFLNFGGPTAEVIEKTEYDFSGGLASGYIFDIFRGVRAEKYGDFRLELAIQDAVERESFNPILGRSRREELTSGIQNVSANLIFRNYWGVLRLGVSYGWD